MCKASMISAYRKDKETYDFSPLFERMRRYFSMSDYVIANLETPISVDNNDLSSEAYSFCSPREFAEAAKESGIDFVSTANNHCLDRGVDGIGSTVRALDEIGFAHTGVFSDPARRTPVVIDIAGIRIGLMAYTYGTNAFANGIYLSEDEQWRVNLFQEQELSNPLLRFLHGHLDGVPYQLLCKMISPISENARKPVYERRERRSAKRELLLRDLTQMRALGPDLVIMCMHAGGQYNPEATRDTMELADWLLNQGVDVIVGSHEHVVHGGSFLRPDGRVVAYCLGNFDGVAGVYGEPFDKMAEYSVAWNLYLDTSKTGSSAIDSMGFSILKSVPLEGTEYGIQVVPAADLYNEEIEREKREALAKDVRLVAKTFCGKDVVGGDIEPEYEIWSKRCV